MGRPRKARVRGDDRDSQTFGERHVDPVGDRDVPPQLVGAWQQREVPMTTNRRIDLVCDEVGRAPLRDRSKEQGMPEMAVLRESDASIRRRASSRLPRSRSIIAKP